MPMRLITPTASPCSMLPSATPVKANGMENMITSGPRKDSNWEAITMYTRMTMRSISRIMSENMDCCSS